MYLSPDAHTAFLPSPASKLQDGAHTQNCRKEEKAVWEEAEGKGRIPSLYVQTEPAIHI